jgi:hypothetical protein
MNNLHRTEQAIKAGLHEPVLRFRGYAMTGSVPHLLAGADWMLLISADTKVEAEEMIKEYGFTMDFHVVVDGGA